MKIARINDKEGVVTHALVEGDDVRPIAGGLFEPIRAAGKSIPLANVDLLAPLVPTNVLCFGRNYKAHAEEGGDELPKVPLLFIKASSCIVGPGDSIVIPDVAPEQVDYEAELAVIIGKTVRNVEPARALDAVFGYTCANDVSARDVQNSDGQWARAKSFDSFGPLGPWIETDLDASNVRIRGRLNGKTMQDASTSLLIFDIPYLISFISKAMTILPGTVVLTGTPAGCGFAQDPPAWLKPGDTFEVEIDGIGTLTNHLKGESRADV